MFCRPAAMLAALAFAGISHAQEFKSLAPYQLAVGGRFEIQTEDRLYRGRLVDRSTGEAQVSSARDGEDFGPERTVYLLGATQGRQDGYLLVKMQQIQVGLKMELAVDDLAEEHRLVTSRVSKIRIMGAEAATAETAGHLAQ